MSITAAWVEGQLSGNAGATSDFTSSGFGTPDAAIIVAFYATGFDASQTSARGSIGFWTSAAQSTCEFYSRTALTTSDTYRNSDDSYAVVITSNTSGESLWTASSITDGIRLTQSGPWSFAIISCPCAVLLLKGLTNKSVGTASLGTGTSAVNVTAPGFRSNLVFITSIGYSSADADRQANTALSFGAAAIDASGTVQQGSVSLWSTDANTGSDCATQIRDDAAVNIISASAETWRGSVSANSNGFAVTPSASSGDSIIHYLAIQCPTDNDGYVGIKNSKTDSGNQAYTGAGFTPIALLLAAPYCTAVNTVTAGIGISIGGASGTTTEGSIRFFDRDAQATTSAGANSNSSDILNHITDSGTDDGIGNLSSLDSDGWTLNYSAGSASALKSLAIAIGNASAGGATVTGTGATIAFAGQQATISQATAITATAATVALTGSQATIRLWQNITGAAPTIAFSGQGAKVVHEARVSGTAATIAWAGQQATISHTAAVIISATAAQIVFTGLQATLVLGAPITVTGTAAEIAFVGGTASVLNPTLISATAPTITFTGLQATLEQAFQLEARAATWAFSGQQATVTLTSGIGGSLIRRRRTKTPWWDEDEALSQLLWALGKAPPERTQRELRAAAKSGLTELIQNEPVAATYADDGALLLETIGQTLRLQGALKRHVEVLLDDEDVSDLLHLII